MKELDPNTIISKVITKKIDDTIDAVKDAFGDAVDRAKAKLNMGYSEYVKRNYAKCAQIKTILYRHHPVLLKKHYVSPHLMLDKKKIEEDEIHDGLASGSKVVIMGTAGSGKSLFMKNAYLEFVNRGKRFVPVFIELRGLNESNSKSLRLHILSEIQHISPMITEEFFDLGMKNGSFAFFLDGFDEVDYKQTKRIEKETLGLTVSFSKCVYIVSSRVDERFFGWQEFNVYRIRPMTKTQVISLISKIEYEEIVKTKFIGKIDGELFETHTEFLSNPLLATIMLLTFEQIADIPGKMHIFYQQAFETLFHRHDATKEMYKRESYTSFPIDVFRRYLGAFCLVTYLDQKFSFDETAALGFLAEAFELEGYKPKEEDAELQFSHRSFQEYFCAAYVCGCDPSVVGKLLDEIVSRAFFDRTLELIRDMNPEIFDRYWTVPRLSQIMSKVKAIDPSVNAKAYMKTFSHQLIAVRRPRIIHFRPHGKIGRNWSLINYIYFGEDWHFSEQVYREKLSLIKQFSGHLLMMRHT